MNKSIITLAVLLALGTAHAQPSQTIGDGSTGSLQNIGDTDASQASSNAHQVNPSANNNDNGLTNTSDIRSQINPNIDTNTNSTATGANQAVTAGRADVNVGPLTTGPSSASTGAIDNRSTAAGGAGGAANASGVNAIDGSGNSRNAVTGGDQRNAQGQGQQQAATANGVNQSRQTTSAGNGAGAGAGSNNRTATVVDAADRSTSNYTAKTTVWAPVVHGATAAPLAAAGMAVILGSCGPVKEVVSSSVIGKRFGIWGGQQDVKQGVTDRAEYPVDQNGQPIRGFYRRGDMMYGERVNRALSVLGTSTGASLSIGGFGSNGQGVQGGGAASGQLQQIAAHVWTEECEAYKVVEQVVITEMREPVYTPPPVIEFTPAPVAPRKQIVKPRRKAAPICLQYAK